MKNLSKDKGCLWTMYLMLTSLLLPLVVLLLVNRPATGQFSPMLDFCKKTKATFAIHDFQ
jgi:hypothetical protein